jgi:hypothetical protein
MDYRSSEFGYFFDDVDDEDEFEEVFFATDDSSARRISGSSTAAALPLVVEPIEPTQHDEGVPEEQLRALLIDNADDQDVVDLDYDSQELVHNPDDPYGILEGCQIVDETASGEEVVDNEVVIVGGPSADRVDVGPNLEADVVEFIEDPTNNAAIRMHDMIAVRTKAWSCPIIEGAQFYRHRALLPPMPEDRIIFGIYERVVKVLVTRRNIKEFKKESRNVYIKLIQSRSSTYWEDLRDQIKKHTYELYARHGREHLQTVFLPEVMQKFADGDVMTYSDFYSLLPTGK